MAKKCPITTYRFTSDNPNIQTGKSKIGIKAMKGSRPNRWRCPANPDSRYEGCNVSVSRYQRNASPPKDLIPAKSAPKTQHQNLQCRFPKTPVVSNTTKNQVAPSDRFGPEVALQPEIHQWTAEWKPKNHSHRRCNSSRALGQQPHDSENTSL